MKTISDRVSINYNGKEYGLLYCDVLWQQPLGDPLCHIGYIGLKRICELLAKKADKRGIYKEIDGMYGAYFSVIRIKGKWHQCQHSTTKSENLILPNFSGSEIDRAARRRLLKTAWIVHQTTFTPSPA